MSLAKKLLLALVLAAFCTVSSFAKPADAHADDGEATMYIWLGVGIVATVGLVYLMVRDPSGGGDAKVIPAEPKTQELASDKWRLRLDANANTDQPDRVVSHGAWPSLNLVTE